VTVLAPFCLLLNMYNEQFFQLFEATISDGELTTQEIEVLRRSAEAMGIDSEKFAIYYEARWAERAERLKHQPGGEEEALAIAQRFDKLKAAFPEGFPTLIPTAGQEQPKKAGPEQHEEMGKCPACKESISGLNHVCPSCGLVIDADHDTHGSLEEMLEEQEQLLLQAKVQARRATNPDLGLAYLVVPFILICLGALLGQYAYMGQAALALWVLAFVVYRVQRKKYKAQQAATAGRPLPELEDAFEKNDRQIALFFGDDARVGQALHTLRQQLSAAKATIRAKRKFPVGRVLVRVALFVPIIIPWIRMLLTVAFPDERVSQIESMLKDNRIEEARQLIEELPDINVYRERLIADWYKASKNQQLDTLQSWLGKQHYVEVKRNMAKQVWNIKYSDRTADRDDFEARKRQLNLALPVQYRLAETELTTADAKD